jgi:succinate dehydrogenase / fumarate reductase membrane anchor subunit
MATLAAPKHRGTAVWWVERLTATALVPLVLWFVASLVALTGAGYEAVTGWLGDPVVATVVIVMLAVMFLHAQLGLRAVMEDYIHNLPVRDALILAMTVSMWVLAGVAIIAVFTIAVGS